MGTMESNTPKTFPIPGKKKNKNECNNQFYLKKKKEKKKLGMRTRTKMHEPKIPKAMRRILMSPMEEMLFSN